MEEFLNFALRKFEDLGDSKSINITTKNSIVFKVAFSLDSVSQKQTLAQIDSKLSDYDGFEDDNPNNLGARAKAHLQTFYDIANIKGRKRLEKFKKECLELLYKEWLKLKSCYWSELWDKAQDVSEQITPSLSPILYYRSEEVKNRIDKEKESRENPRTDELIARPFRSPINELKPFFYKDEIQLEIKPPKKNIFLLLIEKDSRGDIHCLCPSYYAPDYKTFSEGFKNPN